MILARVSSTVSCSGWGTRRRAHALARALLCVLLHLVHGCKAQTLSEVLQLLYANFLTQPTQDLERGFGVGLNATFCFSSVGVVSSITLLFSSGLVEGAQASGGPAKSDLAREKAFPQQIPYAFL